MPGIEELQDSRSLKSSKEKLAVVHSLINSLFLPFHIATRNFVVAKYPRTAAASGTEQDES